MRIHAKFILNTILDSDAPGQQFRQASLAIRDPAQTSSSSKNADPFCELKKQKCELKKQKLFDLTGKDPQCFSHEDGCFAAGNGFQWKPVCTIII